MGGRNPVSLSRLPGHGRNNRRVVFCGPFKAAAFLFIYSYIHVELKHKNTEHVSSPKGWVNWQLWLRTCVVIPVACVHICARVVACQGKTRLTLGGKDNASFVSVPVCFQQAVDWFCSLILCWSPPTSLTIIQKGMEEQSGDPTATEKSSF